MDLWTLIGMSFFILKLAIYSENDTNVSISIPYTNPMRPKFWLIISLFQLIVFRKESIVSVVHHDLNFKNEI